MFLISWYLLNSACKLQSSITRLGMWMRHLWVHEWCCFPSSLDGRGQNLISHRPKYVHQNGRVWMSRFGIAWRQLSFSKIRLRLVKSNSQTKRRCSCGVFQTYLKSTWTGLYSFHRCFAVTLIRQQVVFLSVYSWQYFHSAMFSTHCNGIWYWITSIIWLQP